MIGEIFRAKNCEKEKENNLQKSSKNVHLLSISGSKERRGKHGDKLEQLGTS
jgi:hypothetical protein